MRGYAVRLLEEEHLRYVLVAVVRAEERVPARLHHEERTRRHRLGRVPDDEKVGCVVVRCVEPLHAEVTIVDETVVGVGSYHAAIVFRLDIFDSATHAVKQH